MSSPCAQVGGGWRGLARGRAAALAAMLLAVVLAVVAVLGVNLFGWLKLQSLQWDVTQEKLFTITPATQRVLARLEEPVTLRFYQSRALAERAAPYAAHGARIVALLREYERRAPGRLRVEIIDPEPFSDREDEAIAAGLQAVPLPEGGNAWFGIVGENTTGMREVLPFMPLERAPLLEHDLTMLVHRLGMAKRPVVGVLSSLPLFGGPRPDGRRAQEWAIIAQLRQLFDVRAVNPAGEAEALSGIDVLVVATPVQAQPQTWKAVEQYLRRGGAAVLMIDPYTEAVMGDVAFIGQGTLKADHPLSGILRRLGVEVASGRFVADPAFARRVVFADDAGRRREAPWLAWLELDGDAFSAAQEQLFINAPVMNFGSAGVVRKISGGNGGKEGGDAGGEQVRLEPVIAASDRARLLDVALLFPPDPLKLLAAYEKAGNAGAGEKADAGQRPWLAAWLRGRVQGARKAGADSAAEAVDTAADATNANVAGGRLNVLVIADSDFLADRFWARLQDIGGGRKLVLPLAGNATFLLNALARLTGGEVLQGLSGRMVRQRPFERVEALRAAAEEQYRAREQELQRQLKAAEQRLQAVISSVQQGNAAISLQDRQALQQARQEILKLRRQLRDVQQALARDIRRLEFRLQALNIVGPVVLLALLALAGLGWRRWRAARWQRAGGGRQAGEVRA